MTPDPIHYGGLVRGGRYRDVGLLAVKSSFLQEVGLGLSSNPVENGLFNLQSPGYKGFQ